MGWLARRNTNTGILGTVFHCADPPLSCIHVQESANRSSKWLDYHCVAAIVTLILNQRMVISSRKWAGERFYPDKTAQMRKTAPLEHAHDAS